MGLMYIFPVELDDQDRDDQDRTEVITKENGKQMLILKTYGLPMVFWGYLAAILVVIATMWLASGPILSKLLSYDDTGLRALAYLVKYTLILAPIVFLGFFFFEKHMKKTENSLILIYKIFFIPIFFKKITLNQDNAFSVCHFMSSPNIAKIHNKEELRGFENKGYFELHALSGNKNILIDRHSRKADLLKMKDLLSKY